MNKIIHDQQYESLIKEINIFSEYMKEKRNEKEKEEIGPSEEKSEEKEEIGPSEEKSEEKEDVGESIKKELFMLW